MGGEIKAITIEWSAARDRTQSIDALSSIHRGRQLAPIDRLAIGAALALRHEQLASGRLDRIDEHVSELERQGQMRM
jgi:hypothetical protein